MLSRRELLVATAATLAPRLGRTGTVERGLDPILEWVAGLARAAGFPEYQDGLEAWTIRVDPALARVRRHPAVRALRRARATRGVAFDAIPSLVAHLGGPPSGLSPRVAFDPWPPGLDDRWQGIASAELVAAMADAAAVAGFEAVWEEAAPLRAAVAVALERVASGLDVAWYEQFFGMPLPGRLRVVASMTTGPNNYGAHVLLNGARETFAVLGSWTDGRGAAAVSDISTLVHEVGHDFVNPLVNAHLDLFATAGPRLFATEARARQDRSYTDWANVLRESVLRACVVRYLAAHDGDVRRELAEQEAVGFPWTGALAEALAGYEADRARWPTFESFLPDSSVAVGAAATAEEGRAARVPRVVAVTPADGARAVDPATAALVVTFDRAMAPDSWSICGGGPSPATSNPRFDASGTVFTVDLRLERDHAYELWLNQGRYLGFRAEGGEPLAPVRVAFHTR